MIETRFQKQSVSEIIYTMWKLFRMIVDVIDCEKNGEEKE